MQGLSGAATARWGAATWATTARCNHGLILVRDTFCLQAPAGNMQHSPCRWSEEAQPGQPLHGAERLLPEQRECRRPGRRGQQPWRGRGLSCADPHTCRQLWQQSTPWPPAVQEVTAESMPLCKAWCKLQVARWHSCNGWQLPALWSMPGPHTVCPRIAVPGTPGSAQHARTWHLASSQDDVAACTAGTQGNDANQLRK